MPVKQAALQLQIFTVPVKCCLFEQYLILLSFYLIFYCCLIFSLSADYCEIRAIAIFMKDKCFIRRQNVARKIFFFFFAKLCLNNFVLCCFQFSIKPCFSFKSFFTLTVSCILLLRSLFGNNCCQSFFNSITCAHVMHPKL